MNIFESLKITDVLVILGFFASVIATKVMLTERQKHNEEAIKKITECLSDKAEKKDIDEQKGINNRIFDYIDTKESKEDAREWRDTTRRDLDEIKIAIRDVAVKFDKYIFNGNGNGKND